MSATFRASARISRYISKGLPEEPKHRKYFTSKLVSSSDISLSGMSVGDPSMTMLIVYSEGRLKMWNLLSRATNVFEGGKNI